MSIYRTLEIFDPDGRTSLEPDRLGYLAAATKQKRALHVGCTDWPITRERLQSGNMLHHRLLDVADQVTGIDLSSDGIDIMRAAGVEDVHVIDAETMTFKNEFDVVLAGDVLEHLNNPGLFIERARAALRPGGELVVAVPSALTFANVKAWLKNKEQVHRDHTFYFSPKTLSTLCGRYGLLPTRLRYTVQPADDYESRWYLLARSLILRLWPNAAPAIIMHFAKAEEVDTSVCLTLD